MPGYLLFQLHSDGSVAETKAVEFKDDLSAFEAARKLPVSAIIEAWEGSRLVFRMRADGTAAPL